MRNTLSYAVVLATAALFSCAENKSETTDNASATGGELEKVSWLLGTWQNNSAEGTATEAWTRENDSTLTATSYFVANGADTVSTETILLQERGGKLFYVPTVKDQNQGQPVNFTLTTISDKQLVFENPEHDFPQKITYTRITNDSVVAEISGMIEGKMNAQAYPMKRSR